MWRNSFLILWVSLLLLGSAAYPCTMILVGKGASSDGSVLLAHNNDLPGNIASMIQIVPGQKHRPGETIIFKNGLRIPQVAQTYRMLIMNCYYGFAEGDAKAVNQFQVAIAGGTSLKADRNDQAREKDPLIKGGVSGYVRYIALQRAKSARECVQIIGEMYTKYGISYPSGVGVADAEEAWYMEAGGGRCWVAVRIPRNSYLVAANGYRIGKVNFNDRQNVIYPSYMQSYCIEKKLWKPGQKEFNFAKIFGGKKEAENSYYNARRVWRAQQLLTPSLQQPPGNFAHPLTLQPDKRVTIPQLISILRDHYQGTPFDIAQTNGPKERAIGVFNTVHTSVIQLRGTLPPEIGAVMWGGLSSALTTPYIPYYLGITEIPEAYGIAGPKYDGRSAFWNFRELTVLMEPRFGELAGKIIPKWQELETVLFNQQGSVEEIALKMHDKGPNKALNYLTHYSTGLSLNALEMTKTIKKELLTQISESLGKIH